MYGGFSPTIFPEDVFNMILCDRNDALLLVSGRPLGSGMLFDLVSLFLLVGNAVDSFKTLSSVGESSRKGKPGENVDAFSPTTSQMECHYR